MKKYGFQVYVGSIGHRWSDPCQTYIGRSREQVEDAIERAAEYEIEECKALCDREHPECECEAIWGGHDGECAESCLLCNPDIVTYGVYQEPLRDMLPTSPYCDWERREIITALRKREIASLSI